MNTLPGYLRQAGTALRFLILATVVLGLVYPLAIFGIGQAVAPFQANGSIVKDAAGKPAASALIAQVSADDTGIQDPQWFHARPSAVKWDPASSSRQQPGPQRSQAARRRHRQPVPPSPRQKASAKPTSPPTP